MRRLYGINPWEVTRYTAKEINALGRDMDELQRAEEVARDGGT